jgi:hypothetical protein
MEQRVTRLMPKMEYPYDLVCLPVPNVHIGDQTAHSPYTGTYQVLMRIYSGEQHTPATMLYERQALMNFDQLSDNELQYQLWQIAIDCTQALHSSGLMYHLKGISYK